MGDPSRYPDIRMARTVYALQFVQWLPRDRVIFVMTDSFGNNGSITT